MNAENQIQQLKNMAAHLFRFLEINSYGIQAIADLESFIGSRMMDNPNLSDERLTCLSYAGGAFIGECLIHTYGGHWVKKNDWFFVKCDHFTANPINKVRKFLCYGEEESLTVFWLASQHLPHFPNSNDNDLNI